MVNVASELIRVPFVICSCVLLYYSRAALVSTLLLAVSAWLVFPHPEDSSAGTEAIAYTVSYIVAVAIVAVLSIGVFRRPLRVLINMEFSVVAEASMRALSVPDLKAGFAALATAALLFLATVVVGYEKDGSRRLQSLALIVGVMFGLAVYDEHTGPRGYHVFQSRALVQHATLLSVFALLVLLDVVISTGDQALLILGFVALWGARRLFDLRILLARSASSQKLD